MASIIAVSVGHKVNKGDKLLMMEAMNQYNSIKFPQPETRRLAEAQAKAPANTLLIADIGYVHNHEPIPKLNKYFLGLKHNGNANIVFFDGHVTPHSLRETNDLALQF